MRRNVYQVIVLSILVFSGLPLSARQVGARLHSSAGITVTVDGKTGVYEIRQEQTGWKFTGQIRDLVTNVRRSRGSDRLGHYQEITFNWKSGVGFKGRIEVYEKKPVVIFSLTSMQASVGPVPSFPDFTVFPGSLHYFSYRNTEFAPPSFTLENTCTPWLLFDDSLNAVIISPADNFMTDSMQGDGLNEIAVGSKREMKNIPAQFTRRTIMVLNRGINNAWERWGNVLTTIEGRTCPANDADAGLRYLGYWTDNGATYYYNYDSSFGYAGTLTEVVHRFQKEGIPVRYLQLDSWWYDKSFTGPDGTAGSIKNTKLPAGEWNRYGGLMKYKADSVLFPHGLAAFQNEIGIPLVTHNRWLDPASPYHKEYRTSGFAVVDRKWWDKIMKYLFSANVACYEQDWLSETYRHSPEFSSTISIGKHFLDNMAHAAASSGVDIQYCMALPSFFLQGSQYDNLTTIRVSEDRFERGKWDEFLYTSRLASSLGIWPWSDVFMSDETDNLLLSTLSAGMVGIGDEIGKENKSNIVKSVRSDGVIVKPDVSIVPADEMYVGDADRREQAMVAWTYTDHGTLRTVYVFTYNRRQTETHGNFLPSAFGLNGNVFVYDTHSDSAEQQSANAPFQFTLGKDSTDYYIIAPVGMSGIAFFGDEGKFVCNGRKRIASLVERSNGLIATITFAPEEKSVRIFGYAPGKPTIYAIRGTATGLTFDPGIMKFEVTFSPELKRMREQPGGDEIRQAEILLRCR